MPLRALPSAGVLPTACCWGCGCCFLLLALLLLAPFGFLAPDELVHDVIRNLPDASGYCDSKGLFAARKAVMHYTQQKRIAGVRIEDIYIGNGVSELIVMTMQALLNSGDEVLIPGYLWVSCVGAIVRAGAIPRLVDIDNTFCVSPEDMANKIGPRTKALPR